LSLVALHPPFYYSSSPQASRFLSPLSFGLVVVVVWPWTFVDDVEEGNVALRKEAKEEGAQKREKGHSAVAGQKEVVMVEMEPAAGTADGPMKEAREEELPVMGPVVHMGQICLEWTVGDDWNWIDKMDGLLLLPPMRMMMPSVSSPWTVVVVVPP
jgi:hypothetical protein